MFALCFLPRNWQVQESEALHRQSEACLARSHSSTFEPSEDHSFLLKDNSLFEGEVFIRLSVGNGCRLRGAHKRWGQLAFTWH